MVNADPPPPKHLLVQRRRWRVWLLGLVPIEAAVLGVVIVTLARPGSHVPTPLGVVPPVELLIPAAADPSGAPDTAPATLSATSAGAAHASAAASKPATHRPPTKVRLSAVGIDAPVVPVGVSAQGALGVPDDVNTLGWWRGGSAPGDARGTVVIDGHVDARDQGRGQFFVLERAQPGDAIDVSTAGGIISYVVEAREVFQKSSLPLGTFDRTGAPRLALITCGGPFNSSTGHYLDNVVVFAVPR